MRINLSFYLKYYIFIIGGIMNIGIDIDDTIVNTYEIFVALISMKYGLDYKKILSQNINYPELENNLENYDKIRKDIFSILVKSVILKDDVIKVLSKLKNEGHKIIFITARNFDEYYDPYGITYEYLTKNNVPFDKLIVNAMEKDVVCKNENIDIFIDDNTKHCSKVSNCGIKTIQFNTCFQPSVNGIKLVSNWNEIYDLIKDGINE